MEENKLQQQLPALTTHWPVDKSARTSCVCFDLVVVITHFFSASFSRSSLVNSNCTISGSAPLVRTRWRPYMHTAKTGPRCARKLCTLTATNSEQSLTSHSTYNRSFWRRVFPGNWLCWYWQPKTTQ